MGTVYGSKVNNVFRSYLTYSQSNTSETNTAVYLTGGLDIPNNGYKTSRSFTSTLSATSQTTVSGSIASKTRFGVNSWAIKSQTYNYARTTAAYNVTCKAVLKGSGESTTSTATVTLTIPARNKYTVSYNANGGSGSVSSQSQFYGYNVTLASSGFTRPNYKLIGWKDSAGAGETVTHAFGSSWNVSGNKTMYAVWKLMMVKIKFNCNGGMFDDTTTVYETDEMLVGTEYSVEDMPQQIPTRAGYIFIGWARQNTATKASTFIDSTVTAEEGMNFYAVWTPEYIPMSYRQQNILARRMNSSTWVEDDSGNAMELRLPFTQGRMVSCDAEEESHDLVYTNVTTGLNVTLERKAEGGQWETQVDARSFTGSSILIQDGDEYVLEEFYDIRVTINDSYTATHSNLALVANTIITKAVFVIDVNADGTAASFFTTSPDDNWIDPDDHTKGKENRIYFNGKLFVDDAELRDLR